jgi:hypothetical protein
VNDRLSCQAAQNWTLRAKRIERGQSIGETVLKPPPVPPSQGCSGWNCPAAPPEKLGSSRSRRHQTWGLTSLS